MKRKNYRRRKRIKLLIIFILISVGCMYFYGQQEKIDPYQTVQTETHDAITLIDDRSQFVIAHTDSQTVEQLLDAYGIRLDDHDVLSHDLTQKIVSGDTITISRAKKVTLLADQSEEEFYTLHHTVREALQEKEIIVDTFDIVSPPLHNALSPDETITIIRVRVEEEVRTKKIPFETVANTDDKLGWREKKVTQEGITGTQEITERVSYHDNQEVGREVISEEIVTEPTNEIVTEGTLVKLGKKHKGAASWYAHTGTLSAANPWMPIGSYAKVTNTANGESVIVRINDRGPFVPGRIIDLDKVAWLKIASLGAGVINVKVEEVLN